MGNRYADHVTPLYPQKLAPTSPTGGGRSVGIVRLRTKATQFSLVLGTSHAMLELPDDGLCKTKLVGATIVVLNIFNSLTI